MLNNAGYYLEMAQWILKEPLHPLSGAINWLHTAEPIYVGNQSALLPCMIALLMMASAESMLLLHAAMALMSLACVLLFDRLARRFAPGCALWLTAVFALGPAFLPGQNLMTDVPLLALWLGFFVALLDTDGSCLAPRYALAGVLAGLALLTKYTSLVLLPILAADCVLRRRRRSLWALLLPLGILAAWSATNLIDYGGIHIVGRPVRAVSGSDLVIRGTEWVAGLGSVTPFMLAFLFAPIRAGRLRWVAALFGLAVGGYVFATLTHRPDMTTQIRLLWALGAANGVLCLGLVLGSFMTRACTGDTAADSRMRADRTILALWALGAFGFVVLFAPFMAVRHIMLAIPPLLLILGRDLTNPARRPTALVGLVLTVTLGGLLAVSDYRYAGSYREVAPRIRGEFPETATVYFAGHWGWQWYARRAGMVQYDTTRTVLREGDVLVMPTACLSDQRIREDHQKVLRKLRDIDVPSGPRTLLRSMGMEPLGGCYYFSLSTGAPPYRLSRAPLERFGVFQVEAEPAAPPL